MYGLLGSDNIWPIQLFEYLESEGAKKYQKIEQIEVLSNTNYLSKMKF